MVRLVLILVFVSTWGCNDPAEPTQLSSQDVSPHRGDDAGSMDMAIEEMSGQPDGGLPDTEAEAVDFGTPTRDVGVLLDGSLLQTDAGEVIQDFGGLDAALADMNQVPIEDGDPCPDGWETRALEPTEDGAWEAQGTTDGVESVTEGSCGGGSGQHIYQFAAPARGTYAMELTGDTFAQLGFATVYVRTSCPDAQTELECDGRREPNAGVSVELQAGQTIYIFVDGLRSGQFPSTGGYRLRVSQPTPPVIDDISGWINPTNGSTSVDVDGVSGSAAPAGLQYQFLDDRGQVIASRGSVDPLRFGLVFDTMAQPDGRVTFRGTLDFASDVPVDRRDDVHQMEVSVYDLLGGVSEVVLVRMQAPRELGVGERCDMVSARTMCPAETECFIQDPLIEPNPACHPMGERCPAEWAVWDLNVHRTAGGDWVYEGTLLRGQPPLEEHGRGTCPGATGRNDLFSFVAPVEGVYVFETSGQSGDTIMWIRSACGIIGAASELGCNDDEPGIGRFSRLTLELQAEQTVYVFIDSFGVDERREYTLTVRAP